jgi:hypothetical protein
VTKFGSQQKIMRFWVHIYTILGAIHERLGLTFVFGYAPRVGTLLGQQMGEVREAFRPRTSRPCRLLRVSVVDFDIGLVRRPTSAPRSCLHYPVIVLGGLITLQRHNRTQI